MALCVAVGSRARAGVRRIRYWRPGLSAHGPVHERYEQQLDGSSPQDLVYTRARNPDLQVC